VLERWFAGAETSKEQKFAQASHYDFWRASPEGQVFLIRGYQEDCQHNLSSKAILDSALPIWRLGEVLIHAARLARLLERDANTAVNVVFRARFTGLLGRVLTPSANPLEYSRVKGTATQRGEATVEATVQGERIETELAAVMYPIVASLYEHLGVTGPSERSVQVEVERLIASRRP
jgi:hypothetical protein